MFPYSIDVVRRIVTVRYDDPVTLDRWEATMGAICREPSFDATCGVLSDYRAVVIGPSRAVVKGMVAGLSRWPVLACVRRANLPGPEHENVYGMARMFEILAALHGVGKVSTFKSEDEAVAWLLQESNG